MTPTTKVGQTLLAEHQKVCWEGMTPCSLPGDILAIEAEARAAAIAEVREKVMGLPPHGTGHGIYVWRAAVLDILDRLEANHEQS